MGVQININNRGFKYAYRIVILFLAILIPKRVFDKAAKFIKETDKANNGRAG